MKNTETETAEMAFLKTDGKWMEAKEYYSNDFAGELHNDAQIVNVKLDGMNYVWSAGAGYTRIKASGYYQRNRDTEAWLVTGEVDLTEAIAPQMVFTASADYLYGGKIENAVSVHVSENYIPAASTATEGLGVIRCRSSGLQALKRSKCVLPWLTMWARKYMWHSVMQVILILDLLLHST